MCVCLCLDMLNGLSLPPSALFLFDKLCFCFFVVQYFLCSINVCLFLCLIKCVSVFCSMKCVFVFLFDEMSF